MTFSGVVYTGAVLAATTLFISFVLTAFPSDAYSSRFIMVIAGLLVGASMLAFPTALHNWAVEKTHRRVAIGLYYGEMAIIALNTVVSFAALLYKYAQTPLPAWIVWYEPLSIFSIVYVIVAWGTIRLTDPAAKQKAREQQAEQEAKEKELEAEREFNRRVANKQLEFLDSVEGEDAIVIAAMQKINEKFGASNFEDGKKHFGTGKPVTASSQSFRPAPISTANVPLNGKVKEEDFTPPPQSK